MHKIQKGFNQKKYKRNSNFARNVDENNIPLYLHSRFTSDYTKDQVEEDIPKRVGSCQTKNVYWNRIWWNLIIEQFVCYSQKMSHTIRCSKKFARTNS